MVKLQNISLGVRDFALPIPRVGNIETHSGYGPLPISGQEVHDELIRQRRKSVDGYETEFRLKRSFVHDDYQINVSGRVDGLIEREDRIEEIKSDFNPEILCRMLRENPQHPYWLQVKMYGYIYYLDHGRIPALQLLVVSIRDQSFQALETELNVEEFEKWLELRMLEVIDEFQINEKVVERRKKQAGSLAFPFEEKRIGQDQLIEQVSDSVEHGDALMLQAPTGLGKTLGVMYPALRSSLSRGAQLIYVTPKNSQHAVARDAIQRLKSNGSKLKALIVTAKSKICMKEETICNPDYCEYAKDYYAKLRENDVVKKVVKADLLDRHRFVKYAKKYKVCPFELSLDSIKHVDVVVGDYNYVFSPFNIMGRFSNTFLPNLDKPDLVIDEAHNLPSRACGYYSAALSVAELQELYEKMQHLPEQVAFYSRMLIKDVMAAILAHKPPERERQDCQVTIDKIRFLTLLSRAAELSSDHMKSLIFPSGTDPLLQLHELLESFTSSLNNASHEEFVSLYQSTAGGTLKLVCCDASSMLKDSYKNVRSVVGFSATLKPFKYYSDLMGLDEEKLTTREFTSPFPKGNRKLLVIPQISTKYVDRKRNYGKIAEAISRITAVRRGNYVVFFPSFDFLYQVKQLVKLDGFEVLVQQRDMPQATVEQCLNALRVGNNPMILFAVQGGVFSEGVDYPGDMLIGTIIVGPALPTYDFERETLMRYFDKKYGDGNAYACIYPAMTKVVQSAGRVIRSQDDRGLIVLLGRRFIERDYVQAMPGDWYETSINELVSQSILSDIQSFWSNDGELLSETG